MAILELKVYFLTILRKTSILHLIQFILHMVSPKIFSQILLTIFLKILIVFQKTFIKSRKGYLKRGICGPVKLSGKNISLNGAISIFLMELGEPIIISRFFESLFPSAIFKFFILPLSQKNSSLSLKPNLSTRL